MMPSVYVFLQGIIRMAKNVRAALFVSALSYCGASTLSANAQPNGSGLGGMMGDGWGMGWGMGGFGGIGLLIVSRFSAR